MKKISNFMLPPHFNDLYKNEAISSISLARAVADKINELVAAYNELYQGNLEKEQEQDGRISKAVLFMKDNLLNSLHDLLEIYKDNDEIKSLILSSFNENLIDKLGYVTLSELGGNDNGFVDNSSVINKSSGKYPVIDLLGKSYLISDSITLKNTVLQNGTLIYKGTPDKNIIRILQNGGLKGIKIIVDTPCSVFSGNIILVDYTEISEQWVKEKFTLSELVIDCTKLKEFYENSTAIRIQYDKYKVITCQMIDDVKFYGRIDYGIYIEPLLRNESDNPVYNTSFFKNVFFYSANCLLKVCPKMESGNLENARGEIGLYLEGFANQHIDGINKPFMDLHNTKIEGDQVIPWDYYGENIPESGMYNLHDSYITFPKNYMTVSNDDDSVSFPYKRLSTGEVYSNINAIKPKSVEDNAPIRGSGIAWGIDNIKAVVFKPSEDNPYNQEYIGFELQRNNKSVSNNKAVQFGVSSSGTFAWRQYTEGEGWGELHQIYSQGKIPQSYSGKRPDGTAVGDMKFDTSAKVPVWWNGESWIKADGTAIS